VNGQKRWADPRVRDRLILYMTSGGKTCKITFTVSSHSRYKIERSTLILGKNIGLNKEE
jgi:hypothetical protein